MPGINGSNSGEFFFGPNYNMGVANVLVQQTQTYMPPFPIPDEFLLLDGEFFDLLDGTNLLLLGS